MIVYKNLDLAQVQALAQSLARELKNRSAAIGLTGPLGAGKTTFIQGFAHALGIKQITSPTFVVRHDHDLKKQKLYHLDFYRLQKPEQLADLGLTEILDSENFVLIEWVEKFPQIKKLCDLVITFKIRPNNLRDITIQTN